MINYNELNKESPLNIIKTIGKAIGMEIPDPLPNCKKCNGKGYSALVHNTSEPIPCKCLYRNIPNKIKEIDKNNFGLYKQNRKIKRLLKNDRK